MNHADTVLCPLQPVLIGIVASIRAEVAHEARWYELPLEHRQAHLDEHWAEHSGLCDQRIELERMAATLSATTAPGALLQGAIACGRLEYLTMITCSDRPATERDAQNLAAAVARFIKASFGVESHQYAGFARKLKALAGGELSDQQATKAYREVEDCVRGMCRLIEEMAGVQIDADVADFYIGEPRNDVHSLAV